MPRRASGREISQRELLTMISAIMALMALAIDLMLPAFDDIRADFGIAPDSNQVAQIITVFFLGLAIAQIVYGPLTDRFGRKPVLGAGIAIYALGGIGSALAPNFELLLVARFVWGVGAAGSRVVAIAIIRDNFAGDRMARAMSQIMAVFVLAPILAPSIGAGIIVVFPWRGVFWFCVLWSGLIAAWTTRLPETLAAEDRQPIKLRTVGAAFRRVSRTRDTAFYTLAGTFLQAVFTAYLASSELIIDDILGRGNQFPFIFGAVAVFFGVGAVLNGRLVSRFGARRMARRVLPAIVVLAAILLVVALSTDGRPRFWLFMPLLAAILSLFMLVIPNLNAAAMEPMGDIAGTASSATGGFRIAFGALMAAVVDTQMDASSLTPFVVAVLIFVSCATAATYAGGPVPPPGSGLSLAPASTAAASTKAKDDPTPKAMLRTRR